MSYKNISDKRKYAREYATRERRKRGVSVRGKGWTNQGSFKKGQKVWNTGLPKEKSHLFGKPRLEITPKNKSKNF